MKRAKLPLIAGVLLSCLLAGCAIVPTPLPAPELLPAPTTAPGGPSYAHVRFVRATMESGGTWRFEVTVQHDEEGPEHYVDRWEALIPLPDGQTLSYARPFTQPHPAGQPFQTALSGLRLPAGAAQVTVRAHDSRDGYGGQEVVVDLSVAAGPGFQVVRK